MTMQDELKFSKKRVLYIVRGKQLKLKRSCGLLKSSSASESKFGFCQKIKAEIAHFFGLQLLPLILHLKSYF